MPATSAAPYLHASIDLWIESKKLSYFDRMNRIKNHPIAKLTESATNRTKRLQSRKTLGDVMTELKVIQRVNVAEQLLPYAVTPQWLWSPISATSVPVGDDKHKAASNTIAKYTGWTQIFTDSSSDPSFRKESGIGIYIV